jgi:hypothetical protein
VEAEEGKGTGKRKAYVSWLTGGGEQQEAESFMGNGTPGPGR